VYTKSSPNPAKSPLTKKKIEEKYGLDEEAAEPSDETSEKNDAEYEEKKQ
jgi:hypothetical protein